MDSNASIQSILDTLRTVEFRLGLKGYNVDEVDEYLEKAAVEAENLHAQLQAANDRLRQATERIEELESERGRAADARQPQSEAGTREPSISDDTLQRTLVLAQKFVEQTKRESEAEATEVVARAEERARSVLTQAEERARQISSESEQRLREEVTRLEGMRSRLAADIDAMTKHVEEQRARIRASLTEALKWIDEKVQPSASPGSARAQGPDRGDGGAVQHRGPEGARPQPAPEGARPQPAPERKVAAAGEAAAPSAPAATAATLAGAPGSSAASDRAPTPVGAQASSTARLRRLDAGDDLFEGGRHPE